MANRKEIFGPVALTNTYTTNIFGPAAAGSGTGYTPTATVILLYQIHVANKDSSPRTFRLFVGATGANAAGTELEYDKSVPVGDHVDLFFPSGLRIAGSNFLVGGASAATALTLTAMGEVILA